MELRALIYDMLKEIVISIFLKLLFSLSLQEWLILLLSFLLARVLITLKGKDSLREKLCIDGKPYHDIMLDLLYFSQNNAPNKCTIDTLEWDFTCTYHSGNQDFLDIKEDWTISFSAENCQVSTLKFGIHGGNPDDLQKETVMAYQDGCALDLPKPLAITGKDCESIDFPLVSDVKRGESSKVTLSFVWEKFIVVDRQDDYFYFLPKALAKKVGEFQFKIKHPYNCEPIVYLLRHNWFSDYTKTLITKENEGNYKASFKKQNSMELEFTIKGLEAMDVVLIIFNKSSQ